MTELAQAVDIARDVAHGKRSAVDVIEQAIERIDDLNPALNALVATRNAEALAEALDLDARIRAGLPAGPLAGVPFTVKDVIATAGLPTTCGSRAVIGRTGDADATAVARMRAAGAILIGKTNCPEFAFSIETSNERYGTTTNPLGNFVAGGSSGGEAAALAAGISAAGLGTDFGGSVRWPAQCSSIIGLRPTVGMVPGTGQLPGAGSGPWPPNPRTLQGRLQTIGPMARTVDDVEAILRAISGPDGLDSSAVAVELGDSALVDLGQVDCRWGTTIGDIVVSDDVAVAVESAARALSRATATMVSGLPGSLARAHDLYTRLRASEPLSELRTTVAGAEHALTDPIIDILAAYRPVDDHELALLWAERDKLRFQLLTWLRGDRLLVLPVSVIAPYVSRPLLSPLSGQRLTDAEIVAPCRLISLFGLPSISVPAGTTMTGIPISVQLVAPPFREELLLAAARYLTD